MRVKFNDSNEFIKLDTYVIYSDKVLLIGNGITENLSGFSLYEDDLSTIIMECNNYNYKWNIYTEYENGIMLTCSPDRERESNPNIEPPREIIDPLTNEQLTNCVADLMYETSMMQLGMEV